MRNHFIAALGITTAFLCSFAHGQDKPNILIIWGDDVGMWNISAYHRGMMGGSTPNIDRIAKEGMVFMDHYAQASCTAGRAAFLLGQYPIRTGLATVGLPGAKEGIQDSDPTLAQMLKAEGYATGQFGKNHLGDRDEHLPTAHGFDEFYGILYHLNAGEYVEQNDYPKDEAKQKQLGIKQRGIIHSKALLGGKQELKELGGFGREKQKTLDEEVLVESKRFIKDAVEADKPFFVWHNTTRMHYRTNLNEEYDGKSGYGLYADGMMEMDDDVGELLDTLEDLGVDDNTIVLFATDNGAASNSWPDGGNQPFHGEKGAGGWEGGFRVPVVVKWEGKIPAGTHTGEFMTMEDWMPTLMSWVGQKNIKEELLTGKEIGGQNFRVHLDGYDQSDILLNQCPVVDSCIVAIVNSICIFTQPTAAGCDLFLSPAAYRHNRSNILTNLGEGMKKSFIGLTLVSVLSVAGCTETSEEDLALSESVSAERSAEAGEPATPNAQHVAPNATTPATAVDSSVSGTSTSEENSSKKAVSDEASPISDAQKNFDAGIAAYQANNLPLAFQEFQTAAKKGHADSQFNLGLTGEMIASAQKLSGEMSTAENMLVSLDQFLEQSGSKQ